MIEDLAGRTVFGMTFGSASPICKADTSEEVHLNSFSEDSANEHPIDWHLDPGHGATTGG